MSDVLTPSTEEELAGLIREACKEGRPLEIVGGGTRRGIGHKVEAETLLRTSRLNGITLYEPGALTMVAKAGTPLADIEAALATEGQRLPFEPMDHRAIMGSSGTPTIGGVVACNVSGPRRIQAGACRDSLIGVRFVNGMGEVVKNGGRVMKNVTGLDLVKLLCGSYGTLGVLTELSFKLLPANAHEASLVFDALDWARGVEIMAKALGSPYDVTGAAQTASKTILRVEGFEAQVAYKTEQLQALLGGGEVVADKAHKALWTSIRDVDDFAQRPGQIWRINTQPSVAPRIVRSLQDTYGAHIQLDWGGGLIWALIENAEPSQLRALIPEGHATLIRSNAPACDVFPPQHARLEAISTALRQKFDPNDVLNPGKMGT